MQRHIAANRIGHHGFIAAGEAFDLVVLACKAYDLDAAIEAIAPAMGARTILVPLLNGLAHIDRLRTTFGPARVAGGSCGIPATLSPDGEVHQLGPLHHIVFGPLAGSADQRYCNCSRGWC